MQEITVQNDCNPVEFYEKNTLFNNIINHIKINKYDWFKTYNSYKIEALTFSFSTMCHTMWFHRGKHQNAPCKESKFFYINFASNKMRTPSESA